MNAFKILLLLLAAVQTVSSKKVVEEFVPPSKPDFTALDKWASSEIHTQNEFIQSCKEMAGYYKDPLKNPALKNTIMMGGINYSYRDFYHNFKCYTDKHGIKFLPISLDQDIYNYITTNKVCQTMAPCYKYILISQTILQLTVYCSTLHRSPCLTYPVERKSNLKPLDLEGMLARIT